MGFKGSRVRIPPSRPLNLKDLDAADFGGHGRVDPAFHYPVDAEGIMKVYSPSRAGLVFARM